jgi:hypothetical protein
LESTAPLAVEIHLLQFIQDHIAQFLWILGTFKFSSSVFFLSSRSGLHRKLGRSKGLCCGHVSMLACSRRTIGRSKGAQETPNNWKSHEVDTVSTGQNFSALVSMELIGTHWNSSPFLALLRSRAHVIGYVGCRVSAGQFGGKKMKLKFLK